MRDRRHDERDVVDRADERRAVGAGRAGVDADADREEKRVVECQWNVGGVDLGIEAAKSAGVVGLEGCGGDRGRGGEVEGLG